MRNHSICQGILVEEQPVGLQLAGQAHGLDGIQMLVHVVAKLDAKAEAVADIIKELGDGQLVLQGIVVGALAGSFWGQVHVLHLAAGISAIAAPLHADHLHAVLHEGLHAVADLFQGLAVRMAVDANALAYLAAKQLIDGHVGHLALDVPKGLVHAGNGVVEDGAVAPIGANHGHLPDVLDAGGILAHEQGLHIGVHGMGHGQEPLGIGGAAEAVEPGLAGIHAHNHQRDALGGGANGAYVCDGECHVFCPSIAMIGVFFHAQGHAPLPSIARSV